MRISGSSFARNAVKLDYPLREALAVRSLADDERVHGLLFDHLHFFGDYHRVQRGHGWYQREIRVIRNGIGVRSVRGAQSFRYPDQRRITVPPARARIFHYGWVRHPRFMQAKVREFWSHRRAADQVEEEYGDQEQFDYGPLARLPRLTGTHPEVMRSRIAEMDWSHGLREEDPTGNVRTHRHKDERFKYRLNSGLSRVTGLDLNHKNHGRMLDV